jgi:hypothetical protein
MAIEWETTGHMALAGIDTQHARMAFVKKARGDGYVEYGVQYMESDGGELVTNSGLYSVTRTCVCLDEKVAKENAEKMLTMVFVDQPDSTIIANESHYAKATVDSFDYAVLVKVGNSVEWLRIHEIHDHGDGWVTLDLHDSTFSGNKPDGKVFSKYPMPRGMSVRKDCIIAVVDAPEGS